MLRVADIPDRRKEAGIEYLFHAAQGSPDIGREMLGMPTFISPPITLSRVIPSHRVASKEALSL